MGSAQTLKNEVALSALMYSIYFWFGESGKKRRSAQTYAAQRQG